MLEATTAREHATVDSAGRRFRDDVEPLTNYLVARGQRDWRSGADRLGFITTAVNRRIGTESLDFLRRSAYVAGMDFGHRFAGNVYNLSRIDRRFAHFRRHRGYPERAARVGALLPATRCAYEPIRS